MIFKILLCGLLVLLALFVALQSTSSRAVRYAVLAVLTIGAYLVWRPEQASALAHFVGVGRGADLLMYLWVVITLALLLLLYLKLVAVSRSLTELARRLALSEPMHPPHCANDAINGPGQEALDDSRNKVGAGTTARQGPV